MSRLAALDLGSNSFHLLVADTRPRGRIKRVKTRKLTNRLGEPVARTGKLGKDAFKRAATAFDDLMEIVEDEGAEQVVAVATEALRVAEDGDAFRKEMRKRHGVPIQLLDGRDEAALSLKGIVSAMNLADDAEVLMMDLGGGSLEIALGGTGGMAAGVSLPLGGGKLVDHVSDPPRLHEQAALHRHCMELIQPAAEEILAQRRYPDERLVTYGTAGTIRDLGRLGLKMIGGAVPEKVRGMLVSRDQLELAYAHLCSMDAHARMDIEGISAKRADLLPGAGVAVLATMQALDLPAITLCDWGLREGVLLDVVAGCHIVDPKVVTDR
ncbi:hypothetical protein [Euzebya tangerina]|uniref:Ppx/GppA phosphatase family protein n=1 Tax=Euzebya tangerina TaxID=591198 RepID=UPI0013C2BCE4|nr:hypothetical protein [Euzebya tangerina]